MSSTTPQPLAVSAEVGYRHLSPGRVQAYSSAARLDAIVRLPGGSHIYRNDRAFGVAAAIALLSLAAAAHCGWSANIFSTPSDMFPRNVVGSVIGIGSMAGSVGGLLLATFAGHVLQSTHSYVSLFAIAASVYLLALAVMVLLAPGLRKVVLPA